MKIVLAVLAVAVAGCTLLSPRHDPSRFYTLSARPPAAGPAAAGDAAPSVVVGPVTLPAYLDRNEVAVRVSESELKYALTERWAEPLVQNFTRVLVEDLGYTLGTDRVAALATAPTANPDFWIEVVVVRFEAGADGSAQLTARWALRDGARKIQRIKMHLYMTERLSSPEACKRLVRRALERWRLPYITVTPTFSICPSHGYLSGEHETCPQCESACEIWTRVMGYHRPVSSFNRGKQGEYRERTFFRERTCFESAA